MLDFQYFEAALPFAEFMQQYGGAADRRRWERSLAAVQLTNEQTSLLRQFKRVEKILLLAGAWCGDCAEQCPILERFAEIAPVLQIRYLDRDAEPGLQEDLAINGGQRVPVAVFFSEDGYETARFGDRTLAQYRRLAAAYGAVPRPDADLLAETVRDWLEIVERVQWLLRLSPRLRRLHGD